VSQTRYRTIYPAGRRARLQNRVRTWRWRLWELWEPRLRGGPPLLLGPGAAVTVTGSGMVRRGHGVIARSDLTLAVQGELRFGDRVFLGRGVHITCFDSVSIGSGTRLGERVSIHDENHVVEPLSDADGRGRDYLVAPVVIGERVWLAANVVVLPGVTIGDDAVVAAASVVTADIPAGVLAAGAPATVRRELRR
jgi:maltose O-acetyltransferase